MSKEQQDIPQPNKPFSLRVIYAGNGAYAIIFSYQEITVFQPISDEQYREIGSCAICAL